MLSSEHSTPTSSTPLDARHCSKTKAQEFKTLKRVYCATPACGRFLGPLLSRKVFTCASPTCTTVTSGKCLAMYEGQNHNCTPDAEIERILTLSNASGWSRCPGCSQMIELAFGCLHIICRCKTQFCYLCRKRWKTCSCPEWDEVRLHATAQYLVDAQLQHANRVQLANAPQRAPPFTLTWVMVAARCVGSWGMQLIGWLLLPIRVCLVLSIIVFLRMFHNCQHPTWDRLSGSGTCKSCSGCSRRFLFVSPFR
jgi:hypothetical protein